MATNHMQVPLSMKIVENASLKGAADHLLRSLRQLLFLSLNCLDIRASVKQADRDMHYFYSTLQHPSCCEIRQSVKLPNSQSALTYPFIERLENLVDLYNSNAQRFYLS